MKFEIQFKSQDKSNQNRVGQIIFIKAQAMQKGQEYLRFGQIIRIHGHKCLQNESSSKQDSKPTGQALKVKPKQDSGVQTRGMIAVKGFTDKDAKYLTFEHFKNCQFYRQTLFQILPRGIFEKCDNQEEQLKKKKLYEQLCAQRMGENVKFGEDVVFRHVDSLDYLSGSVRCSDGGLGAFRVELSDKLYINLVFKLYPFRSFQKQGDKIKLQSPLRIKNIQNRCYFSTQKNQNKYSIVTTYSQSFTWLIHLHESHETLTDADKIRTHDILLLRHTKNDGYLCLDKKRGEDAKDEVVPCIKLPLEQTGYHCFTCLWEIQKFSVPKISPYFESDKLEMGTEGTYSLRQLLTGSYLEINKVKETKEGSFPSQNNLEGPNYQISIKSAKGLPNVSDYLKHNGLIKIGGVKSNQSSREDQIDAAEQITTVSDLLRYREQSPYKVNEVKKSEAQSQHGFRIIKIDEESKRQVLLILSTFEVLDEFAYLLKMDIQKFNNVSSKKIDMIDLTLQKLISFIKNCSLNDIQLDVLPIKKRQFICMDLQICQKLFEILKEMGIKILEEIYKQQKVQNEAFKTTFNRAYYLILQIIKNNPITKLYVCESWLDIILDHAIQNEEERVHETLNQILQSNELVVTKFLKANNNHLVQRIIDIFTLKPPHEKFLNIFRASCMSNGAPIVGNQKLILNLFFRSLDEVSRFKFLATLKKSDENEIPVLESGERTELQKPEPQIQQILVRCYISKDNLDSRSLKDFFKDSSRLDLSQTSNYFIAYLNLLADICYGRNTEAKKYVQEIMVPTIKVGSFMPEENVQLTSLDTLIGILEDKQIQTVKGANNLLRAVIRLINYAYVVSADQNPVLRINRYRNLDNMEKQKVSVGPKFKKVMKFIKDKLSSFQSFFSVQIDVDLDKKAEQKINEEKDDEKKQQLKKQRQKERQKEREIISLQQKNLMLTVLELLKSTLVIGYWTIKEQQYELFPLLLKILSNQKKDILHNKQNLSKSEELREFEKFKNEVSQSTLSVQLIKNCKALACELIEIIFDFRHDNLVTQCVNFYKQIGLQESQSIMDIPGASIQLNLAKTTSNIKVHPLYNAELWKETMQEIFKQPTDEQSRQVREATKIMSPLMVELSIHKDPVLFFRSLKIMKRHFEYRNDIMKLFLSLSIYDNQNGVNLAHQINEKRKILGKLEEENLLYSSVRGVYDEIMSFLVWLSESIKQRANLSIKPEFKDFVNIFSHFNEESRINKFHQRLIKNKDLHPIMLNFIGLSKQPIRDFKGDSRLVLKYVYRFLSLLAKSFSQAKSEMIYMKDKIFDHVKQQCENIRIKHDPEKRRGIQYSVDQYNVFDQFDIETAQHIINTGEVKESDLINLQIRDDCEAITLLAELFNHNKQIIYNEVLMEQLSVQVSEMINTTPIKNYYKSHLLDFFRTMIYYKDGHIKSNQARILAKLQDSKKKSIYYRFDKANPKQPALTPEHMQQLIQKWETMNKELLTIKQPGEPYPLEKHQERTVIIMPELSYFITMLNLFANLVQGKHDVNIGKCRQVHRYVELMKILKNSSICYPLKTYLRQYINELYYSTNIEEDLCTQIIRQEIPQIIQDLNILICILVKKRQGKYKLAHPIRFKYYDTYIYLYVEQIVFSLNYLQSDPTFIGILTRQLKDDFSNGFFYLHYYIMRIYERLRWLLNYFYGHKYIRGFLNKITNQMKNQFLKEFQKNMFKTFDRNEQKMHDPNGYKPGEKRSKKQLNLGRQQALKRRSKDLLYKLVKAQIKQYFTVKRPEKDKNFPLTFVLPYGDQAQNPPQNILQSANTKEDDLSLLAEKLRILFMPKQKEQNKQKLRKNHYLQLKKLQESLSSNSKFNLFMTHFKGSQCIELYKIDDFSKTRYGFNEKFVSLQEYIKNFVKVNTQEPDSISNDLKIFFFEVLLEYITQHNKQTQKSVQDWQKDDWEGVKQEIIKSQLFLSGADVAGLIIENLKTSDDIYLSAHVLLFGIAYLIGGSTVCQTSILEKLREDTKNDVFIKIEKLISKLGKKITTRISQRTSHKEPYEGQFVVEALDQYDYYDQKIKAMKRSVLVQKTSKDEEQQERIQRAVFSRLFKFLQLLCECNNYDLKHFVRIQTNTDGSKKNYSFNVINMTTFEIRRLFKVMCQQACKVVLPLTDFLNQVVTVPCTQNQVSLCQTTFFEDLCYMANTFNNIRVRQARKFDEPESKKRLFETYQKCILIILNVLQGNEAKLNKQLLIKLDVSFLLFVIKENLKFLSIYTKQDLKQLLENVENQKKKVPVQLQNAMNVMIVLLKLQDCEGSERFKEKKAAYLKEYAKKPPSKKQKLGHQEDSEPELNPKIQLEELLVALKDEMLMIEVISSKGNQKIYFPKHPILTKLSGATRDRIMTEVSRSTQREKIKSLFSFKDDIFTEIEHNFKIQKEKFLFGLMSYEPSTIAKLQEYSFKASYLALVLWFLTTDIIVQYHEVIFFEPYFVRPVLFGINLVQLFITLAYFSSYKVCTYELAKFRAKKQQEQLEKQEERLKPKQEQVVQDKKEGEDKEKVQTQNTQNSGSVIKRVLQSIGRWIVGKITSSELFVLLKFDQKFKYVLMYLITSLLGTFYSQTAFLFYIIYYFLQNETLSNVFNAIFYNLNQLFSVGLLGVVFVYIFSLIFYQTYALDVMAQKDPDDACDSILSCIMDLYVSGTIGGSVDEFTFMRFATDLIYFIFFGLLFGNIVSGIMIDTFAELRSKRQQMNDDKKNRCYICGKDRAQLQKANENFDGHIQNKHFLWNYIYYMYCLKEKNLTDFSGLQYEIKECIDKGENDEQYIQWIPFSSESGDEHGGKIDKLNETMKEVNTQANTKITQLKSQSSKGTGEVEAAE